MATQKGLVVKEEFSELSRIKKRYTEEQKAFIQKTLAPTLNENELLLFLYRAKKLGLNPLQGEISAHAREGKHGRQLVVVIGKDGKARKAMQTGLVEYAKVEAIYTKVDKFPMYKKIVGKDGSGFLQQIKGTQKEMQIKVMPWEGGQLWGARAEVKRKDIAEPFEVVVPLSEYKSGLLYGEKPDTMIKKTALSQCYTLAFPDLFAGVYIEGEVDETPRHRPLAIPGGEGEASEVQLTTIKSMGGKIEGKLTKQRAADLIRELSNKKK